MGNEKHNKIVYSILLMYRIVVRRLQKGLKLNQGNRDCKEIQSHWAICLHPRKKDNMSTPFA